MRAVDASEQTVLNHSDLNGGGPGDLLLLLLLLLQPMVLSPI